MINTLIDDKMKYSINQLKMDTLFVDTISN